MSIHYLAKLNKHERDDGISFEEGPHIYTVMGERGTYTSVTTWNHSHFSDFDADAVIDKMMKGRNWNDPTYKYYGMTREEIKGMWNKKRDASSGAGTNMHYDIECFYNEMDVVNDSIEYKYFMEFVLVHPELKAYRTEWMIFHEELKLSGSIDMVFENPDGTIQIYDWKRCEEIKFENGFNQFAKTECINHLPDSNFWHYSLQLNTYRRILEEKYNKKVTDLFLVCLHPNNCNKSFQEIRVPFLDREIDDLFEMRREQVLSGEDKIKKH
jgi:ATP-dependent exoDNAse (exonuclease V) beta subunit